MSAKRKKKAPAKACASLPVPKYVPTPAEQAEVNAFANAWRHKPPGVEITKQGAVVPTHPDEEVGLVQLVKSLGITERGFADPFLSQLLNVGTQGQKPDSAGLNFMVSVIQGIQPKDQLEAMLGAQMAAVHMATMTFARRLAHVSNLAQQDSAERAFNKLAWTFTTQMEALKRYRSTGEQKMTVEHQHVTVNEGGQAIVGNVTTGEGATETGRFASLQNEWKVA